MRSLAADGRVVYGLRQRWRDGTTHVVFEPLDFLAKLAALVPPPRFHRVRYHGVLAAAAGQRSRIVPEGTESVPAVARHAGCAGPEPAAPVEVAGGSAGRRPPRPRNYGWAELMRRVWAVDVLACAACHGRMRIVAALHSAETIRAILDCLGLPARAPPVAGALDGESIDLMNGNVNLRIPIGPRYMLNEWFGYQIALYYNSKIWQHECFRILSEDPCPGVFVDDPNNWGLGFRLHFGRIYHHPDEKSGVYRYETPDGALRYFCTTEAAGCPVPHTTLDASAIHVEKIGSYWHLWPGDGTEVVFEHWAGQPGSPAPGSNPDGGWYATRIQTVDGAQWVQIEYEAGTSSLIDRITDSAERASVDTSKPAISRPFKTGHSSDGRDRVRFTAQPSPYASRSGPWCASCGVRT